MRADRAFTGRCNLFAESAGILVVDKNAIDALNRVDEAITVATLPAYKPVVEGEMIATVKIIPFAVAAVRARSGGRGRRKGEAGHSHSTLQSSKSRRGLDFVARPVAKGHRQDPEDHCHTNCACWRENHCRAARAARAGRRLLAQLTNC